MLKTALLQWKMCAGALVRAPAGHTHRLLWQRLISSRSAPRGVNPPAAASAAPHPSAASEAEVYTDPEVYDIAFGFRDFAQEVNFLLGTYRQHCAAPLRRFLELGAGPATHSILLAKAASAEAVAVDLSPEMVEYARQKAASADLGAGSVRCLQADMTRPLPDELHGSIDLAAILLGSLAHCTDNATALACFHQASRCLRPGGMLVLELPHPEELFSGAYCGLETYGDGWDAASEDGSKRVLVEWGREGDEFDCGKQLLHRTVGLSVYQGDDLVSSKVEVVTQRQFTLQEVDLLGRAAGLEVVAVHGDFASDVALEDEEAYRMLVWLQKQESG